MLKFHMAVVTRDNALKRAIKRLTTATGSTADYIGDASGFAPDKPVSLAIYDAREQPPDKLFFQKVPADAKIIYVIEPDALIQKVQLFKDERVVALFCYDAAFDDDEFVATATKALRGEIFGLQKYFPWGVTAFSMVVKNHAEKVKAIEILMQYANLAGVRGPVRDRIQLVADELMMNALYHAPVDKDGKELYAGKTLKELSQLENVNAIEVRYACSGRYFGISVRDGGGSLVRDRALEYMKKAQATAAIETKSTGAGLGLVSVLKSCSKLVFNLEPTFSTEVVALFDMELFGKGKVGARSLHLFVAPPGPPEVDDVAPGAGEGGGGGGGGGGAANQEAPQAAAAPAPASKVPAVMAGILGAVAAAMLTMVLMRGSTDAKASATAAGAPTLVVNAEPADAQVLVNGSQVASGRPITLPAKKEWTVEVSKDGYRSEKFSLKDSGRDQQLSVRLLPAQ